MPAALNIFTPATAPASLDTLAAIAVYARSVNDAGELASLAARINAARELAKAQDDVRDIRRMLMHADVAVLVRRYELEDPELTTWDKIAVKAFKRAGDTETQDYVDAHFEEYGRAMQVGRALHLGQKAEDEEDEGAKFVNDYEERAKWAKSRTDDFADKNEDPEWIKAIQQDVADFMKELVDSYTVEGEPFTVESLMDAVLDHPEFKRGESDWLSDAYRDGVRRICREAVRRAGDIRFEGESMPTTVAIESEHGWVRIPLGSATPSDLAATIREREIQIANDQASVDRLSRFLGSITAIGCGEFEPIASYLPAA